ncbi:hypothetical protein [uncultured Jatrophihabitans sp.]|uniref:hypothetical protein n=1 Tax=uncultured Jatrophihabitans sp. TaxID=1610747 RepID=UPI0035CC80A3
MRLRRAPLVLVLPAAAVLAACSSTTAGKGSEDTAAATAGSTSTSTSTSSASTSSASAPSTTASTPADAHGLGALLQRGVANVQSAHFTLDTKIATQSVTGTGDEKLDHGKVQAFRVTETIGSAGEIEIILVDGKAYAKLPATLNTSGKPFVLLSTNSSNATIRQLAASITSSLSSGASLQSINALATAATSTRLVGKQEINGVQATHYDLVIDPTKITTDPTTKQGLTQSGITSIPMQLYVDSQGRPVEVDENITVSGQTVTTKVALSRYNQPVTITAPPASQVSTR